MREAVLLLFESKTNIITLEIKFLGMKRER